MGGWKLRSLGGALASACALVLLTPVSFASETTPVSVSDSVVIDVDLDQFLMRVVRDGQPGPEFEVALGSPSHPTPPGSYRLQRVIRRPAWNPGPEARRRGKTAVAPSSDGPMGVAKIPFEGSFMLHAGAKPLEIGKRTTLGCVQVSNDAMDELLTWFESEGLLSTAKEVSGELHHALRVPVELRIQR